MSIATGENTVKTATKLPNVEFPLWRTMAKTVTRKRGPIDKILETVCERLPNCGQAMALIATACERPLSGWEKIRFSYHGRLCPFCGCAAGKFTSGLNRIREAEAQRNKPSG